MKKFLLLLLGSFFLMAGIALAAPITVHDLYWGGTPTKSTYPNQDVIGVEADFGISHAVISLSGTSLIVDIYTGFAGKAGVFANYTINKNGIGYGDLFLASAWEPYGDAPHSGDNHLTGTLWTYGFALDDRWDNSGGIGTLYSLNGGTNADNALLSEDFMVRYSDHRTIWREGQEVAVNPFGTIREIRTGDWAIYSNYIRFSFDIAGTTLLNGPEIAFHWTQTCGNDVIEGKAPVPEPATMLLLGFGLVGLAVIGRRKLR